MGFLHREGSSVHAFVRVVLLIALAATALAPSVAQQVTDLPAEELPVVSPESSSRRTQLAPLPSRRGSSDANSEFLPVTANRRISNVEFDRIPLAEAMQTLSKEVGLNVVTSADAGTKPITVYLEDVTAIDAIDAIVKANGLFYRVEEPSGIIRIATREEYERDLSSFRDQETRVFTLLYPNPTAVAQAIQHVYGNRVQLNSADNDFTDFIELTQRFNRFDLVDGRALGLGTFGGGGLGQGVGGGIGTGLGRGGLGVGGLGGGLGGLGGGLGGLGGLGGFSGGLGGGLTNRSRSRINQQSLVSPEGEPLSDLSSAEIQAIENQLASGELDEEQRSELLQRKEATIYVSTIRRNNQVVVRTGDPRTMEQIAQLIAQLDVPTPTVLLEVKVLRVDLADGFNSAFEYFVGDSLTPPPPFPTELRSLSHPWSIRESFPHSYHFPEVREQRGRSQTGSGFPAISQGR